MGDDGLGLGSGGEGSGNLAKQQPPREGIPPRESQLAAFGIATLMFRDIRPMIEGGNVAAALTLSGIQIAIGLLNAGAMAG